MLIESKIKTDSEEFQTNYTAMLAQCEQLQERLELVRQGGGPAAQERFRSRGKLLPRERIEPGESPDSAALREAYEESGAILSRLRLIGRYLLEPCSVAEPEPCSAPVFLARAERLEPLQPDSESQGVLWASLDEMPALYYDWSPLIETVFRYAEERRKALWER